MVGRVIRTIGLCFHDDAGNVPLGSYVNKHAAHQVTGNYHRRASIEGTG
jgi:hypothetical protein